jgi:hypothetical protein
VAHHISGLVAKYEPLAAAVRPPIVVAPLAYGYGLAVHDDWTIRVEEEPEEPPHDAVSLAATLGKTVPIAFVATEYSGGPGEQGAAAWGLNFELPYGIADAAINRALRLIGVVVTDKLDEFDTIGLGWYRSNDDWIEFATSGKADWQDEAWPDAAEAFRNKSKTLGNDHG